MRSPRTACAVLALCAGLAGPAAAHHSFAMFDRTRTVSVKGVVKDFQWTNPHVWIEVAAAGPDGKAVIYSIEGSAVVVLKRMGWSSTTFRPGDAVTVSYHPMKDGSPGGGFSSAVLADGRTVAIESGTGEIANAGKRY